MKTYLRIETKDKHDSLLNNSETPSVEKIGLLLGRAVTRLGENKKIGGALTDLGLHAKDTKARECMSDLLQKLTGAYMLPLDGSPRVYWVTDLTGADIAVFKVGEQRAEIECLVRQLAFLLNLESCVPPGIFCAVENICSGNNFARIDPEISKFSDMGIILDFESKTC